MKRLLLLAVFVAGCSSGPVPPDWLLGARGALENFQKRYLEGDTRGAELEFARARADLAGTGNAGLVARAELIRCAVRAASLEFDPCPGFEKLRLDAGAEELAYADFLAGRAARTAAEDPLSRLVGFGIQFKSGKATPESIQSSVDISSSQGWRRPLLAWLGVQEKRAEAAGDREAAARIRRRMTLVLEAGALRAR